MNKKEMKFYETPEMELVEFDVEGQILAGSDPEGGELEEGQINYGD